MRIEDLTPDHIRAMKNPRVHQAYAQQLHEPENPLWFTGTGWACIDDNEEVFALTGLVALDNYGRFRSWTILTENIGTKRLMFVARNIRRFLDYEAEYRRIEAISDVNAEDELFWIRYVLRFTPEGRMRAWLPDGTDVYLFSRVKGRE